MTARTIPVPGEPFLGDDPAVMKVLKVTYGDSDKDVSMNDGDTTQGLGRALCSLPYGIHVYDVGWRVITAFTAAVDLTLGNDCTSDCDFFAKDADMACTTVQLDMRNSKSIGGSFDSAAFCDTLLRQFGFTPDSDGNNLMVHGWPADSDHDEAGHIEFYVYYHAAVSS